MKKYLFVWLWCLFSGLSVWASSSSATIELTKINDRVWVHTSYSNYMGNLIPSHGLLALTKAGVILVDTPWTNDQTKELLTMVKQKFDRPIKLAIFTHWHQDRIGGIDALIAEHIATASTAATAEFAVKAGFPKPKTMINPKIESFKVDDLLFETYFPGPAHTMDNLVVYFPKTKVLYGGCLVKPITAANLGNVVDGDVTLYAKTVQELMKRYPKAKTVIANHGPWGDFRLLEHTLQLAKAKSGM